MVKPIYDPTSKIDRTGQEIAQNIDSMFESEVERMRRKNRRVKQAQDEIRAVKKELGKLGSDYVREEIDSTLKNMKKDIFEQKKNSSDFRINESELSNYEYELDRLENLAANTKQFDQAYEDAMQFLNRNKEYINPVARAEFQDEILRDFSDPDYLAENTPEEIQADLYTRAKDSINKVDLILDNAELNENTISTTFSDGSSLTEKKVDWMDWVPETDENGNPIAGEGMYLPNDNFDVAVDNIIAQEGIDPETLTDEEIDEIEVGLIAKATSVRKEEETDWLARASKKALLDQRKNNNTGEGASTEEPNYVDVLAWDIVKGATQNDANIQRKAKKALEGAKGIDLDFTTGRKLKSEINKVRVDDPNYETLKSIDTENLEDDATYVMLNGKPQNISDPESAQLAIHSALQTRVKDGGMDDIAKNWYRRYHSGDDSKDNKKKKLDW